MFALLIATFFYIGLSAATALAPRASSVPVSYYRPAWQCPSKDADGQVIIGFNTVLGTSVISCVSGLTTICDYSTATGLQTRNSPFCAPSVIANSGCHYECPTTTRSGYPLYSVTTQSGRTLCVYKNAGVSTSCQYDPNGAGITTTSTNTADCYGPLPLDCGATPTKRRNYRSKNNYTAWLERRGQRQIIPAAVPQPAPGLPLRR